MFGSNVAANPDFEMGGGQSWWWFNVGGGAVTATTAQAHGGSYSGVTSNRTAAWNGIGTYLYSLASDPDVLLVTPGSTYHVEAAVRLSNPTPPVTDTVNITVKTVCGTTEGYVNVDSGTASTSGWLVLSGDFTVNTCVDLNEILLFAEGAASGTDIYIDDVSVREVL